MRNLVVCIEKWIFILELVPGLLLTVRSPGGGRRRGWLIYLTLTI